ncbi:MAG: hypothetical protein ACI4WU_02265 [Bacilli bacterium]
MKVIDIYGKNDLDRLMIDKRTVKEIMDSFFMKYPVRYRKNYDRNLKYLELYQLDEINESWRAKYFPTIDKILFIEPYHVVHELMHMAHYDRKKKLMAIEQKDILWEDALIEGAAEYLANEATGYPTCAYMFETFVICMLSSIDNFFEPFFIPNYEQFIKLFPNKKDILSLMYALDFYHNNCNIGMNSEKYPLVVNKLGIAIREVIDSLINIEVGIDRDEYSRRLYQEKFMDLITSELVHLNLVNYFDNYKDYANDQLKRKIRVK